METSEDEAFSTPNSMASHHHLPFMPFLFILGFLFPSLAQHAPNLTTVVVKSSINFGFFLPPIPMGLIGDYESDGIAFCTNTSDPQAMCRAFPASFIISAFFRREENNNFVQVTGQLDGSLYTDPSDEGGQYDHLDSPVGGQCFGYDYFVSLVEPAENRFCIRCCKREADCPTGKSEAGCPEVIPGLYSP